MSRSAGPGSPVWFRCHRERLGYGRLAGHAVLRTGRERPYKPPMYSARGIRSEFVSREYLCSCGHVGWSNHKNLARHALVPSNLGSKADR